MSTCNWLDLQALGSRPIMPKNLPIIGWDTIALRNGLHEQQTLHAIQIVIRLVSIIKTNPKSFKVSFKTQPIALGT